MSTMTTMTASFPPSIRLAQAVGIMTSAFLSGEFLEPPREPSFHLRASRILTSFAGGVLAVSYGFVPSMSLAPNTLLVREWHTTYGRGIAASPALAAVSAVSFVYLSYNLSFTLNHHKAEVYALAALVTGSIVPFTLIFMKNVNGKLYNKVEKSKGLDRTEEMDEKEDKKGERSHELLGWWAIMNTSRALLPFTGACLGIYASFFMSS